MGKLSVLAQIAFRNLFSSGMNLVIGGIVLVGTLLIVAGSSLLNSMDRAMSRSIIGSIAGHAQVFSAKSKDEVSLFGNLGGDPDLSPIGDFAKVKASLSGIENVQTVVPMGIASALVASGNTADLALANLRDKLDQRRRQGPSPSLDQEIDSLKQHVRQIVSVLQGDLKNLRVIGNEKAIDPENEQAIAKAASDPFWRSFDRDPFGSLEFLENKIAPQVADADMLFLRYVGTDLDLFQKSFDRMVISKGTPVPKGHRGLLLSTYFHEERCKLKTAHRLDQIREAITQKKKTIATDSELLRWVKENQEQTREIVLQLDALKTQEVVARLQQSLHSTKSDVTELLVELFQINDQNFEERYRIFYDRLAPLLELYRVRVGDTLTIKSFTRSGYAQAINIKVYGTFKFEGLERSALAGAANLMDLVSFRALYGYMTPDKLEEIRRMQQTSGARMVDRSNAEAELFGTATQTVFEGRAGGINPDAESSIGKVTRDDVDQTYSQDEIEQGLVLNAAVLLKDPRKLDRTIREIQVVSDRDGLGLKAVSWQKASGLVGQFVVVAKLVLYFAVAIIFIVALVIINNAMMMATLQRVKEIGTLRAIGAQRGFVLSMVLTETLFLGLVFGAIGSLFGSGLMTYLGRVGIPAKNDALFFFFSGPRLYPTLSAWNLVAAFVVILLVSAISTSYPAIVATRVSPVVAMQTEE